MSVCPLQPGIPRVGSDADLALRLQRVRFYLQSRHRAALLPALCLVPYADFFQFFRCGKLSHPRMQQEERSCVCRGPDKTEVTAMATHDGERSCGAVQI